MGPIVWPKVSQASCGVLRGDSGFVSRPCRKRRASSCDDGGILWFFWRFGGILYLPRGTQGASLVAPGKSNPHSRSEEELGIALESLQSK